MQNAECKMQNYRGLRRIIDKVVVTRNLALLRKEETNYQKSSIKIKKDVNKTIKEKRHNKTDVQDAKFKINEKSRGSLVKLT